MNLSPAYIAGLFDGEGSVGASIKRSGQLSLEVKISQATRTILDLVHTTLGYGQVSERKTQLGDSYYEFRMFSVDHMARFINDIGPYSIIKRDQLTILEQLLSTYSCTRRRLPSHIWEQRYALAREIARLK